MSRLSESPSAGNHNSTSAEQLTRDLFDRGEPRYPAFPGHRKGSDTSREAAEKIAPVASTLRGRVARLFKENFPGSFTADEAAKALNLSPFAIRPRVTELAAAGLLEKTGERRSNPHSSMRANCWRAAGPLLDQEDR
jgi:hypothetical protein